MLPQDAPGGATLEVWEVWGRATAPIATADEKQWLQQRLLDCKGVLFADDVRYRGRLLARVYSTDPPRWRVHFEDGETSEDILLAS